MKIEKGKLYYDTLKQEVFKCSVSQDEYAPATDKIAVVCNSEEDWKYVKEKLPYLRINNTMKHNIQKYEGATLIGLNEEGGYCNLHYYTSQGFHIIPIEIFKEIYPEKENDDNVQNNRHKCLDKAKDILDNIPNDLTAKFGEGGDIDLTIDRGHKDVIKPQGVLSHLAHGITHSKGMGFGSELKKDVGHKESDNKLNYELDFDFITQMSERMQTNKGKYEPYNWKKPIDVESLKQALFRHVIEVMKGNYQDDGRLMGHLEAISCNAMMLNYQLKNK